MVIAPRMRKMYFHRSSTGCEICPTPYATNPPNIPAQPLKEHQIRTRNGTSFCVYQTDVRIVRPGVTTASTRPRKKLHPRVNESNPGYGSSHTD